LTVGATAAGYQREQVVDLARIARHPDHDVSRQTLEIAIPVPDGEIYWRYTASHGAGTVINSLPDDKRAELHHRLVAAVDTAAGITLRRSATLALAVRP
jgi:hypothetical protein